MNYVLNKTYISDFEAKKAIVDIGKRMYNKGFVASNDGNISIKVGTNAIWCTPTGVSKGFMTPEMMVKLDLNGKVLMGREKPSSEIKMHLRVYMENPDVMAVTHAHPPVATSYAIAGIPLDRAILPEAVVQLGNVPVAPYATPGTQEVPDSIAAFCKTHNGVLLANHGALTWGKSVIEAYHRLESLEYYATIMMYTGRIIEKVNELSCSQIGELIDIRKKLGIQSGGIPACDENVPGPVSVKACNGDCKSCSCTTHNPSNVKPVIIPENKSENKEELINEIVRRVTEQIRNIGR